MRQNLVKQMKFIGIIPARFASTRFPGKPLAVLGGKPVIQRVYEQVESVLGEAYVATDDERIFKAVEAFGGSAVMINLAKKNDTIASVCKVMHSEAEEEDIEEAEILSEEIENNNNE